MSNRILVVMAGERGARMRSLLADSGLEVQQAASIAEAQERLAGPPRFDLAFVDSELPDGSWRDMLQFIIASGNPSRSGCELVVCARCGDERLWAEVIQCGAFDLVPEPFEKQEILRIIRSALDSRYLRHFAADASVRAS